MKRCLCIPAAGLFLLLLMMAGCAATVERPLRDIPPVRAMIPVHGPSDMEDDQDLTSLNTAMETSIRYYERLGDRERYCFQEACYSGREMIEAFRLFQSIINSDSPWKEKTEKIKAHFEFHQSTGNDGIGTVLVTGYYEPILDGSLQKTSRFRYPLYSVPEETVSIPLGKFNAKYGQDALIGRLKGKEVVPHYTRKEIETDKALADRGLEIAWVDDPVALFILHIQGSGQIRLPGGKILRVNYAQKNGRPFRGLTSYMVKKGYLAETEKSYQHMKAYLLAHPETRDDIMNHNESYIFFRIVAEGPLGSLGLPVVASRSIASDPAFFPKGAAAFLVSRKPVFNPQGQIDKWVSYSRFVVNHDTGGAIKGPGRIDLFCGTGTDAEQLAGSLKEKARLYFLAPRRP